MPKKFTYEEVYSFFKEHDCQLVSTEYNGQLVPLDYICVCGNPSKISFNSFKRGSRCKECGIKKAHDKTKYTYIQVKDIFESNGCILLSETYVNNGTLMDYICECGNPAKIRLNDLIRGIRCKKCATERVCEQIKLNYDDVKKEFEQENCILLSPNYVNVHAMMDFICSCGNETKTTLNSFRRGARCDDCRTKKVREKTALPYEYVKLKFEESGCTLVSTEYINSNSLLEYICSCGNESKISYDNFRSGARCMKCSGKTEWTIELLKEVFENNGCKLTATEFLGADISYSYICECGEQSFARIYDMIDGRKCKKCGIEKRSRENSYNWNGGASSLYNSLRGYCLDWKKASMRNSNFKCVITGKRFDEIHHLYGFDSIMVELFETTNLPIKETIGEYTKEENDILKQKCIELHYKYPLGVCLTEKIHDEFHKIYGYGKNTPEQFYEFYRLKTGKEFYIEQTIDNAI